MSHTHSLSLSLSLSSKSLRMSVVQTNSSCHIAISFLRRCHKNWHTHTRYSLFFLSCSHTFSFKYTRTLSQLPLSLSHTLSHMFIEAPIHTLTLSHNPYLSLTYVHLRAHTHSQSTITHTQALTQKLPSKHKIWNFMMSLKISINYVRSVRHFVDNFKLPNHVSF